MLVKHFDQHFNTGPYALLHYHFDHMVEDIRLFGAPSVLDTTSYRQYKVDIRKHRKCLHTITNVEKN